MSNLVFWENKKKKCSLSSTDYKIIVSVADPDRPSLSRQSSSGQSIPLLGEFSTVSIPPVKMDEKERPANALQILKIVCESPVLKPHLRDLLSSR